MKHVSLNIINDFPLKIFNFIKNKFLQVYSQEIFNNLRRHYAQRFAYKFNYLLNTAPTFRIITDFPDLVNS